MSNFVFALPTRVVFGPGTVETVGKEAANHGRLALLVTGSTFARRSGLIERIQYFLKSAGLTVVLFDELDQNPTVEVIDRGAALARTEKTDVVIGLGGGSALDAAKAIAACSHDTRSIWEYVQHCPDQQVVRVEQALPVIQVPIIASTGSETNDTAVILDRDSRTRAPITSPHLFARVAIVDPTLTFTVPARYTAVGAMNIVSHMVEGYLTGDEFAVTDRVTEGLIRVVMSSLERALRYGDDLDARTNLSWAATMASTVALAGRGHIMPLRALAHPLTATFQLEHGAALAGLWPSYMRYALGNRVRLPQVGRFKRYALLGRQIFGVHETDDEVAAESTVFRFMHWLQSVGMPADLHRLNVDPTQVSALVAQALAVSGNGKHLPGGLSSRDIEHIYDDALRPARDERHVS